MHIARKLRSSYGRSDSVDNAVLIDKRQEGTKVIGGPIKLLDAKLDGPDWE